MEKENYYNKKYFDWQKKVGEIGGEINKSKFIKYINEKDTVLDYGCGGGYLLKNINCAKKIGIEINTEAQKLCAINGIEVHPDTSGIPDNSIDVIISNHALEHVERPMDELRKLHKALKKDGKIILSLPFDDYRSSKKYNKNDINNHLYTWNVQLIGNCLKSSGFKNIEARVYTHAWPERGYAILYKNLPLKIFDFLCYISSIIHRRRQIIAIATK